MKENYQFHEMDFWIDQQMSQCWQDYTAFHFQISSRPKQAKFSEHMFTSTVRKQQRTVSLCKNLEHMFAASTTVLPKTSLFLTQKRNWILWFPEIMDFQKSQLSLKNFANWLTFFLTIWPHVLKVSFQLSWIYSWRVVTHLVWGLKKRLDHWPSILL